MATAEISFGQFPPKKCMTYFSWIKRNEKAERGLESCLWSGNPDEDAVAALCCLVFMSMPTKKKNKKKKPGLAPAAAAAEGVYEGLQTDPSLLQSTEHG